MDKRREQADHDHFDPEELELANGEPLPERQAMSIIRPDLATMPPVLVDDGNPLGGSVENPVEPPAQA